MSVAINRVIIAGNLTRDPEIKTIEGSKVVGKYLPRHQPSLAQRRRRAQGRGHLCRLRSLGRTAELAGQYLTKGSPCLIEGRLRLDQWQSNDGKKQSRLKVVAESIQFLSSRSDGNAAANYPANSSNRMSRVGEGPSLEESMTARDDMETAPF